MIQNNCDLIIHLIGVLLSNSLINAIFIGAVIAYDAALKQQPHVWVIQSDYHEENYQSCGDRGL